MTTYFLDDNTSSNPILTYSTSTSNTTYLTGSSTNISRHIVPMWTITAPTPISFTPNMITAGYYSIIVGSNSNIVIEPIIDRIFEENKKEFSIGDLIKSLDNKIGLILELISSKNKHNCKVYYYKVLYDTKYEIWGQFVNV